MNWPLLRVVSGFGRHTPAFRWHVLPVPRLLDTSEKRKLTNLSCRQHSIAGRNCARCRPDEPCKRLVLFLSIVCVYFRPWPFELAGLLVKFHGTAVRRIERWKQREAPQHVHLCTQNELLNEHHDLRLLQLPSLHVLRASIRQSAH